MSEIETAAIAREAIELNKEDAYRREVERFRAAHLYFTRSLEETESKIATLQENRVSLLRNLELLEKGTIPKKENSWNSGGYQIDGLLYDDNFYPVNNGMNASTSASAAVSNISFRG